jgi:guanine nucleotide-binding protein subunit alpha
LLNHACSFLDDLDRFFEANYLPTDQDILYAKSRTIGVVETVFEVDGWTYRMVDVGGQRSERKKWIRAFDSVGAVIFLASISAYDQCIAEDPSMVYHQPHPAAWPRTPRRTS